MLKGVFKMKELLKDLDSVCHAIFTTFIVILFLLCRHNIGVFTVEMAVGISLAWVAYIIVYILKNIVEIIKE